MDLFGVGHDLGPEKHFGSVHVFHFPALRIIIIIIKIYFVQSMWSILYSTISYSKQFLNNKCIITNILSKIALRPMSRIDAPFSRYSFPILHSCALLNNSTAHCALWYLHYSTKKAKAFLHFRHMFWFWTKKDFEVWNILSCKRRTKVN